MELIVIDHKDVDYILNQSRDKNYHRSTLRQYLLDHRTRTRRRIPLSNTNHKWPPFSILTILTILLLHIITIVHSAIHPPRDLSVQVQSGKLVLLDWNPPIEGRFHSFKIIIEPLSVQDDSGIRTIVVGLQDATPVPIRDLTPGASYQIRLYTVYRNEDSRQYLQANFTTDPAPLPEPKIWFRNETTLLVKLANPAETIFDHYSVKIIPEDAYESVKIIERPELGHRPSVAFHGLTAGKAYNISVQTQSMDRWSEPTVATFTTMPLAPGHITDHEDYPARTYSHSVPTSIQQHTPPTFTNGGPPEMLTIQDGRDAEIQCEATGSPFPTVEWWYQNTGQPKRRLDLDSKRKYDSNAHGALIITQVEKSDEGMYTCVRRNNLGVINGTTRLAVILRTQIDQPPVDSKVILSSTAELQCRVRHDPTIPVKVYWTFQKRNLTALTSSRIKIAADNTLRIEQVRNTDVGLYTCRVESDGGNDKRSARLDVIELPHPPTNVVATLNVNGGLVNVSWTPPFDGNSPITKYVVQMRTIASNPISHAETDSSTITGATAQQPSTDDELVYGVNTWTTASMNISSTQNFVLITNLRPATTYQFRVSALNSVGEGQPSSPTNPPITLPAQPPNASPIGVVGAPRSSTAITIQWQQPPPESHNGHLLGYIVRYKLAGYAEHTPWYTYNVTNAAQMSCLLEDLIVWQNYQIQVAAYNEMGIGLYSPSIYVRTKEGRPAAQVRALHAEAINSTSIRVQWSPPDPQLINGINQGYKVQAWISKNFTTTTTDPTEDDRLLASPPESNTHSYTIVGLVSEQPAREITVPPSPFYQDGQQLAIMDGLEPYTTYDVSVLCFTSAGDGPRFEPPPIVTTEQDLPQEVAYLKFRDILDKSVRVIWSRPKKVNGKLTGYTLRYYSVGHERSTAVVRNLTATENQTVITNLTPQTAYTFEINAWTEVGAGPIISSTIQSSVPPVLPVAPTHLAISNIQPFSVVLQFTPGFNGNASIAKWIVEGQLYKLRNAENWSVIYESINHTQDDAITVHNLRPYTEYRLRLIPVNVVGPALKPSAPSPPFQTLQALPQGPPSNVTVRTVSATALRVRWTPLPPESWHGHPRGYNITWRQLTNDGSPIIDEPLHWHILSDYHSHSYLITSLNAYTNYGIQVFALNDLGTSHGSHYHIQRTNEATPSSGPNSVQVRSTSSTTIVVDWNDVGESDRNGIIQGFKVRYAILKNGNDAQFKLIESNSSRTATLTELKKYTRYQISVCAFTHVGDGVYSTPVTAETFQDVPGPPSNVTFPDVTLTTARIKWDIPEEPNGEILAYKVTYRLSDDQYYQQIPITREFQSTDRTYRFLDLSPETYYKFEVTAKTVEGWGQAAKALVYTTNTRELPSPPSQPLISVSQISSRQVTISWTPGRDGYAPLRYYTVQISSQGGHWWTYPHKIDPTIRSYTLTKLRPFTTYQFRLKATNDIGDSGWSSESPITRTLPAPPDTMPESVTVSPFTPTSISVRWMPVNDWNGDEMGAGYRVQYCLLTQQGVAGSCPSTLVRGKNRTQATIDNLEKDQHYEIRVIAFNGQGDGPSTKPKVVYVGEAVPTGEPLEIRAEPLSSTEIKVTWQPPDQSKQNGQIMGYKIFYWVNSLNKSNLVKDQHSKSLPREMMEIVPDTLASFILLDLYKWTNYSIQISAFNPAGDGPRSKPTIVQTLEDLPGELGPIEFDEITMSQVKVTWRPPAEPNGLLLGYYITYETLIGDFSKQVKQKINDSYLVVSALRERVTYTFKVRAENSVGLGPERIGNVTTGPQHGSPPPPFEVIAQQTLTSVKLKWKNPDYREPILGYLIEANNLNKKSALEWQPIVTLRNGRQDRYELSFTQLSPSSQYQFRVMSFNRIGVSEPAYPNKLYGGQSIIMTPSHLELRARMPYYRETWFVILCACLSVIITIMVIAALCVRNKTYKYKKEAMQNTGSQDRLSELGFGLDEQFDNPLSQMAGQSLEMEMRGMINGGSTVGLIMPNMTINNDTLVPVAVAGTSNRNDRNRSTLRSNRGKSKDNKANNMLNTAAISAQARQPPRPCPGSFSYSDEDDLDDDDDLDVDDSDVKPPPGLYELSSGNDSLTEKPSELSSTGPDSEDSDDHDELVAANMFVNHYANVNDTLRKGLSWKKQAKPYIVPTSSHQNIYATSTSIRAPPSHPPPPNPTSAATSSRSAYKQLPYPPPPPLPPMIQSTTVSKVPTPPPSSPLAPSTSSHHGSNYNITSNQQPQSSLSKFTTGSSASQSSINRIGFPNRPPPPAPAPPSYLSALNGDNEVDNTVSSNQPQSNVGNNNNTNNSNSSNNALNGGRIIVNNMAGSRAPLPGFSSFV
ncbi:sidekick cell adhesion molecule [Dermatophagoides pteronyssinus]|uniref:sidekick cell adhesion molecule n=1 Tax=Dermatophagoides pteronyssinus TaxID=6956 RepID=UPI003F67FAAF